MSRIESETESKRSDGWWPPARGLRRLYDWTLQWAETRYGTPALALLAFAESSFFPIPPDILLIALGAGRPKRALWYALVATVSSVAGGVLGYFLGAWFMDTIGETILGLYHLQDKFEFVQERYRETAFLAIFTAGLTPIPYKVFTLAAGAAQIAMPVFIIASVFGRGLRFFAVGTLLFFFGAPVRGFIDRYFDKLAIAFTVLLIGGLLAARYLF